MLEPPENGRVTACSLTGKTGRNAGFICDEVRKTCERHAKTCAQATPTRHTTRFPRCCGTASATGISSDRSPEAPVPPPQVGPARTCRQKLCAQWAIGTLGAFLRAALRSLQFGCGATWRHLLAVRVLFLATAYADTPICSAHRKQKAPASLPGLVCGVAREGRAVRPPAAPAASGPGHRCPRSGRRGRRRGWWHRRCR